MIRLNRHLTLQERVHTPDGAGGYVNGWRVLGHVWADVRNLSGRDAAGETLAVSTTEYRITVRAAPMGDPARPKPDQRFIEGTRIFRIEAVTELDPDARYLICTANEESVT